MSNSYKNNGNGNGGRFDLLSDNNRSPFGNKDNKKRDDNKKKDDNNILEDNKPNRFLSTNKVYDRRQDRSTHSKPKLETKVEPKIEINLSENYNELFPQAVSNKQDNSKEDSTAINFSKLEWTKKNNIDDNLVTNKLQPGHEKWSFIDGKWIYERGPYTEWELQKDAENEYKKSAHYIMSTAIEKMEKMWDSYEQEYDYVNGEGAYREYIGYYPMEFSEDEDDLTDDDNDEYGADDEY